MFGMLDEKRRVVRYIPVRGIPAARVGSKGIMLEITKPRHGYEHIGHRVGCLCEGCEFEVVAGAEAGDVQAKEFLTAYAQKRD
jgi:hypothetical protein